MIHRPASRHRSLVAAVGFAAAVAAMLTATTASANSAEQTLEPFAAHYEGSKRFAVFTVRGELDLRLSRHGDYLKYTSDGEVSWSFIEREIYDCSVMRIEDGKLYPLAYHHIDKGDDENNIVTTYDWANKQATVNRFDRPEPQTLDITWPTWDPMSFQVAIMAGASMQPAGSSQQTQMLERNHLSPYTIYFNGEVDTETELPDLSVFEVVTQEEGDDDTGTLWLTPEFFWIPAKIEVDEAFFHLQAPPTYENLPLEGEQDIPEC